MQITFHIHSCNEFLDGASGDETSIEKFIKKYFSDAQLSRSMCALVYNFASTLATDGQTEIIIKKLSPEDQERLRTHKHDDWETDFKTLMTEFGMRKAPRSRDGRKYTEWLEKSPQKVKR